MRLVSAGFRWRSLNRTGFNKLHFVYILFLVKLTQGKLGPPRNHQVTWVVLLKFCWGRLRASSHDDHAMTKEQTGEAHAHPWLRRTSSSRRPVSLSGVRAFHWLVSALQLLRYTHRTWWWTAPATPQDLLFHFMFFFYMGVIIQSKCGLRVVSK